MLQKGSYLNRLQSNLPEGLLADTRWLKEHGFSRQLWNHYVASGWLERPARGVFVRPRGALLWQHVVISLQNLLKLPLVVGGRTALDLQGFSHYLAREAKEVHLYGRVAPPTWLAKLNADVRFVSHLSTKLFRDDPITRGLETLNWNLRDDWQEDREALEGGFVRHPWGHGTGQSRFPAPSGRSWS